MVIPSLIQHKRDGHALAPGDWARLVADYTAGRIPDYQISALLMAVVFRGLTTEELAARWGIHPESVKRAVRNGSSPVLPIIPGAGRWVFSIRAVEHAEENTFNR